MDVLDADDVPMDANEKGLIEGPSIPGGRSQRRERRSKVGRLAKGPFKASVWRSAGQTTATEWRFCTSVARSKSISTIPACLHQ